MIPEVFITTKLALEALVLGKTLLSSESASTLAPGLSFFPFE